MSWAKSGRVRLLGQNPRRRRGSVSGRALSPFDIKRSCCVGNRWLRCKPAVAAARSRRTWIVSTIKVVGRWLSLQRCSLWNRIVRELVPRHCCIPKSGARTCTNGTNGCIGAITSHAGLVRLLKRLSLRLGLIRDTLCQRFLLRSFLSDIVACLRLLRLLTSHGKRLSLFLDPRDRYEINRSCWINSSLSIVASPSLGVLICICVGGVIRIRRRPGDRLSRF